MTYDACTDLSDEDGGGGEVLSAGSKTPTKKPTHIATFRLSLPRKSLGKPV